MTAIPDAIYLSPHLDDAVLSCGGQIAEHKLSGQDIRIITVFAATEPSPPCESELVKSLHAVFRLPEGGVVAARRVEDAAAMRTLKCEVEHWNLTEAIYRTAGNSGPALYPSLKALFGPPAPEDSATESALCERLASLPDAARIVVPLGIGGQVDHILLRRVAEACFDFEKLFYYEDYPYVERPLALWKGLGWRREWKAIMESFSAVALDTKLAAIRCYRSQVRPLFGSNERMERRIRRFAFRRGGERLWTRKCRNM